MSVVYTRRTNQAMDADSPAAHSISTNQASKRSSMQPTFGLPVLRLALLAILLGGISTSAFAGYGHWLELRLENRYSTRVVFEIAESSCMGVNGSAEQNGNSRRVIRGNRFVVEPGGSVILGFNHDPASRCDGQPADFSVRVGTDPHLVYFRSFENGKVALNSYYPDTPYEGSEVTADGIGRSEGGRFRWGTQSSPLTAGRPVGSWERFCQQFCDVTLKEELLNTKTQTSGQSSETKKALSVALEGGLSFPGGSSAKATVTATEENTVGRTMSRELSNATMSGQERKVLISLEQMEERNLFAVWQWVVTSSLSDGGVATLKTVKYTCTPAAEAPTYLPGSPEDVRACRKAPAQPTAQTISVVTQPVPSAQPVAAATQPTPQQLQELAQQRAAQQEAAQQAAQKLAAQQAAVQQQLAQQQAAQQSAQQQAAQKLAAQQAAQQQLAQQNAAGPVSVKLSLQSSLQPGARGRNRIPLNRTDPAYTVEHLDIVPAIYLDVTFAPGNPTDPRDYKRLFAQNVVFDDVSGDPNDLIQVVYGDVDRNNPQLGRYGAQLTSTGKGTGMAFLSVSFRNAPGVTASIAVQIVSSAQVQPPTDGSLQNGLNLSGQWKGQYTCAPGTRYLELIAITQQGQQIVAQKVSGDPCVPAGYKTFQGVLTGNSGQLTCFGGTPQRPASGSFPGTLRMITAESFEACGVQFQR